MENKTFKIEQLPDSEFKIAEMRAIELMALQTQLDFDSFEKSEKAFTYMLEHIVVRVGNEWLPVKEKGQDIFYPNGIENNLKALNALTKVFIREVIKPLFPKSSESMKAH